MNALEAIDREGEVTRISAQAADCLSRRGHGEFRPPVPARRRDAGIHHRGSEKTLREGPRSFPRGDPLLPRRPLCPGRQGLRENSGEASTIARSAPLPSFSHERAGAFGAGLHVSIHWPPRRPIFCARDGGDASAAQKVIEILMEHPYLLSHYQMAYVRATCRRGTGTTTCGFVVLPRCLAVQSGGSELSCPSISTAFAKRKGPQRLGRSSRNSSPTILACNPQSTRCMFSTQCS